MLFGAIRSIIRPVSRALLYSRTTTSTLSNPLFSATYKNELHPLFGSLHQSQMVWRPASARFIFSLTDTRPQKKKPSKKPRRKRARMKPKGPFAWVKHVPDEPIPASQPNVKFLKNRKKRRRMRHHNAILLVEKRKLRVHLKESRQKKIMRRKERRMAAEARDRAWVIRLAELQKIEEDKKKAAST